MVYVTLATLVIKTSKIHSTWRSRRANYVLALLILELREVRRLEGTWCFVLNLELSFLLIEVPRSLLGSFSCVDVVFCVVALQHWIILVLK
jgi:hypothetical protein